MYLGVSIVAMYDLVEVIIISVYKFVKQRRAKKKKRKLQTTKAFKKRIPDYYEENNSFRRRATVYSYRDKY